MIEFQSFWFVNRFIEIVPDCRFLGIVTRLVVETEKINLPRKRNKKIM
jgi:hypothetical protein